MDTTQSLPGPLTSKITVLFAIRSMICHQQFLVLPKIFKTSNDRVQNISRLIRGHHDEMVPIPQTPAIDAADSSLFVVVRVGLARSMRRIFRRKGNKNSSHQPSSG